MLADCLLRHSRLREVLSVLGVAATFLFQPVNAEPSRFDGGIPLAHGCWAPGSDKGQFGRVTISFLVGPEGLVREANIVTPSPHAELDGALIAVLSKCRFRPVTVDGVPQKAWIDVVHDWENYPRPVDPRYASTWVVGPGSALYAPAPRTPPAGWTLVSGDGATDRSVGGWFLELASTRDEEEGYKIVGLLLDRRDPVRARMYVSADSYRKTYHIVMGPYERSFHANQARRFYLDRDLARQALIMKATPTIKPSAFIVN